MTCWATLIFQLSTGREALPISGAKITVTGDDGFHRTIVTGAAGRTPPLSLPAPDPALSLDPEAKELPCSLYDAQVTAEGYLPVKVAGIQVFQGAEAIEAISLSPRPRGCDAGRVQTYTIPPSGLRLIPEGCPDSPQGAETAAPPVTGSVRIPLNITVHLGPPDSTAAQNVTVSFPNYIKNAASCALYPTWPENALRANIHCLVSVALSRIYTKWYRGRGHNFDITNTASYDQSYVHGRNIFGSVSRLVDEIFSEYLRRPGGDDPFFGEVCNGAAATCQGLSPWGSVAMAQNGYTAQSILKRTFGSTIEVAAGEIQGIHPPYPGEPLRLGSAGPMVRVIESRLSRLSRNYPSVSLIASVDNTYTAETEDAVATFQRVFSLTPDGVVGRATWNRISAIYQGVRGLAELEVEGVIIPAAIPTGLLREGGTGAEVELAQRQLRVIASYCEQVRPVEVDGVFGPGTKHGVLDFQKDAGLTADGIIGPATWKALMDSCLGIAATCGLVVPAPDAPLGEGSRGDLVWLMQAYLRTVSRRYPIPVIVADGIFGPATRNAVAGFQRLFGLEADGLIGTATWNRIVATRLSIR